MQLDLSRIVPDPSRTIRSGAIAPWSIPVFQRYLDEFLAVASKLDIPVDIAFERLAPAQVELLIQGVAGSGYSGLRGFFRDLEARSQQISNRLFLNRFRRLEVCPACHGRACDRKRLPSRSTAGASPSFRP